MPTTPVLWRNIGQVNTIDSGLNGDDQILPAAIQLANGNVLVTWQSNTDAGAGAAIGTDVIGQILDPAGNKVGGEFRINSSAQWNEGVPALAALGSGGFAAVYERHDATKGGGDSSVTLEIYNAAGTSIIQTSIAADNGTTHYSMPDVAYSSTGTVMVAYMRDFGGGDQDVLFQVRNQVGGTVLGPTVAFNGVAGAGAAIDSLSVAALQGGNFVIAFSDADSATDSDIDLRLYNGNGGFIKNVSVVSGSIRNDDVDVTALSGGGFVVTWTQDASGGSDSTVLAKVYDAAGVSVSSDITVPTTGAGNQNEPSVGALADGGFVIAWVDAQGQDIRAQRFDAGGNKVGVELLVADGALFGPNTPVVTGLADGRFSISWTTNTFTGDHDVVSAIFDPRDTANVGTASDDVIAGTVNDDADLSGGLGNDRIYGGGGNDLLNGGLGADVLDGGDGIDTASYAAAAVGVVVNLATGVGATGEATGDTLASIENLTGSGFNDHLTGTADANVLNGGDGGDTLWGGLGADTLIGGTGFDVALYNDGNYGDLVLSLAAPGQNTGAAAGDTYDSIEGLGGGAGNDTVTGDAQNNSLFGNEGNDTLDGGLGFDFLSGGLGDDTYIVDTTLDQVTDVAGGGIDTVVSSANWGLGGLLENLVLTGTADIFGGGNGQDNAITGNAGNNLIDGLGGADTMAGGAGDDTYIVDNGGDSVTEGAGKGTDKVESSVTYTLGSNVENLTLTGAFDINGTGNTLGNIITGNGQDNILDGKGGADTLAGGDGHDIYIVDNAGDVVAEAASGGVDQVQSSVTYALGAEVENLALTGNAIIDGTGNGLDNVLFGNAKKNTLTGLGGADTLDGQGGADIMVGGTGDDTYVVDNVGDVVTELGNQGVDTVESSVTFTLSANVENLILTGTAAINGTGNTLGNTLTGNDWANVLNGLGGVDTMIGGKGDDTYVVDNVGDVLIEAANAGTDTAQSSVTYTISPDVDNLILTGNAIINGTGNEQFNAITGNAKANVLTGLEGDDVLDGQGGADTMIGGIQDDTYYVDNLGDTIVEGDQSDDGLDSVFSSISYTLADNVENLTLTGASNINGTGNASMNVLTGNDKNNILDGGAGADELWGGLGNDTYHLDDMADFVIEEAGGGIDKVFSSVGFSAAAQEIEYITLTGTDAVNADGNAIANTITGNGADNVLKGGLGNDTFVFSTALGATNIDSLLDFATTIDKIALDNAIFTKAGPLGALADGAFAMGTAATEADDRILYDTITGALYYDADGNKAGGLDAVQFAFLESGMDDLAASEFLVV
ncbi:calcium-binding protein [Oleomonas cavernae]|uniref:Calcium-binding protein n=1 Tax=Oleomonas cavernae TaxID=2320859 RepID=A0A418W9B5_9PROT|nr:calcium-binding protein [Oleomonas cavernae]RJF86607.1 calcium-binding protein [Oleomonas cavernae]